MAGTESQPERRTPTESDPLASARLDELLLHLQTRFTDVIATQERLRSLVDAVMVVGSDLDLHSVLGRITESACRLVGARYGALAIVGSDGRITEFITRGMSDAERALIGPLPEGKGVLGLLIQEPRPMRLSDLGEHPTSYGFPPHHPPMTTLLGVPIHLRDEFFGNLYLTEKQGGAEFTAEDEEAVVALATAAGVAIENARLYENERRRQRWLQAAAEITELTLGEIDRTAAMRLVARRVREVAGADSVGIILADSDDPNGDPVIEAFDGLGLEEAAGMRVPGARMTRRVMDTGERLLIEDLGKDDRIAASDDPVARRFAAIGQCMVLPLRSSIGVLGVLVVGWRRDTAVSRKLDVEAQLLEGFAAQTALVLGRVRAQEDRERLLLLEDRDRIARDLHDVVIQRLFATGMRLQMAVPLAARPEVRDRLNEAIDALDATNRDIRSAIFGLNRAQRAESIRDRIDDELRAAEDALGFRPRLVVRGAIEHGLPADLQDDLQAVLREALSNVARHAGATTVEIGILLTDELVLTVADDGIGIGEPERHSGLANLEDRARRRDGHCAVTAAPTGGTLLVWRVPVAGSG
ncbi:GAF domain-containing sensor histidine kinase [Flindersiella endophytica]